MRQKIRPIGGMLGAETTGMRHVRVAPGAHGTPHHCHGAEEELFVVLGGDGVVRLGDEEVLKRCLWALVNEGARILEEGIALRASDIDVTYLYGYGFPRYRGGPMFYADQCGLTDVARTLRRIAAVPGNDPAIWTPAPLLEWASGGAAGTAGPTAERLAELLPKDSAA